MLNLLTAMVWSANGAMFLVTWHSPHPSIAAAMAGIIVVRSLFAVFRER